MSHQHLQLDTQLIHAGRGESYAGAAVAPIFRSTVFEVGPDTPYYAIRYPRLSTTPNHDEVSQKLAALEGAECAMVTGSGMAAISTALLATVGSGDRLLCQEQLYGGSHSLVTEDLPRLGVDVAFIDARSPESWAEAANDRTRVLYVETMSNPLLRVGDHRQLVSFAKEHGLTTIIDSTFAPAINFRPLELGYDIVVHSATKYLNGHSDLAAGAIATRRELMEPIAKLLAHLGGVLDPQGCFLLARGLKTLGLRVRRQNQTAQALAEHLMGHPAISTIHYPGLSSHPQHDLAKELFSGFGGVLSYELEAGADAADRFIGALELAFNGPSLGGVETLVTRPVLTSHRGVPAADRARLGLSDGLVRMSVGLEDAGDLIADIDQALA